MDIGLNLQSGHAEQLTVRSSAEIDSVSGQPQGVLQRDHKKDAEESRGEHTTLHCCGCQLMNNHRTSDVSVKGLNH